MTEKAKGELVTTNAEVKLEEIAAIKVAEIERQLMVHVEELRAKIKAEEKAIKGLTEKSHAGIDPDTREAYPEIGQVEKAVKKLFKSFKKMEIGVSCNDKSKVCISISGFQAELPWKGKSKELNDEIGKRQKGVEKLEEELIDTRKKLTQLSHIERSVKAEVAKIKLSGSKEGKQILSRIKNIGMPGLPAPK